MHDLERAYHRASQKSSLSLENPDDVKALLFEHIRSMGQEIMQEADRIFEGPLVVREMMHRIRRHANDA